MIIIPQNIILEWLGSMSTKNFTVKWIILFIFLVFACMACMAHTCVLMQIKNIIIIIIFRMLTKFSIKNFLKKKRNKKKKKVLYLKIVNTEN